VSDQVILLHLSTLKPLNVVVPKDEVETVVRGKRMKQVKRSPMRTLDRTQSAVLPEFVAIPDLHVRKPTAVVVAKCLDEEIFILCKGVRPGAVTAVEIAKEDQAGIIVERYRLSSSKGLSHPPVCARAHDVPQGDELLQGETVYGYVLTER
jgi:hypothetical protein